MGAPFNSAAIPSCSYDTPHLAMTYAALLSLLILQDDLNNVQVSTFSSPTHTNKQKDEIIKTLAKCQKEDGSFSPFVESSESDMRFLFCACAISAILNDWSGINQEKALSYIQKSQSFDGGFGTGPSRESHGGSTYCAVAALCLLGKVNDGLVDCDRLLYWLISRQDQGFHGRINKPDDTCYGYWIGSCLNVLLTFVL